jgi:hypothetical protein
MSNQEQETAKSGTAEFEEFVGLIAAAMCSGVAFLSDGMGKGELDASRPLEPQARGYARDFIKYRGRFELGDVLAKRDSEVAAKALEDAADSYKGGVSRWLRARAAALRVQGEQKP